MTAGYGMQAAESVVTTLSWDQIEKYIHAMITYGLYMDANEAALVDKTEMERVSYQIGYFLRDWIDDVPEELNSIEKIETLLSTHEGREQLESFLEDVDARISYGELKPKTVKSPGYLLSEIADLDRERIHFPLHDTVDSTDRKIYNHTGRNRLCPLHWKWFCRWKISNLRIFHGPA